MKTTTAFMFILFSITILHHIVAGDTCPHHFRKLAHGVRVKCMRECYIRHHNNEEPLIYTEGWFGAQLKESSIFCFNHHRQSYENICNSLESSETNQNFYCDDFPYFEDQDAFWNSYHSLEYLPQFDGHRVVIGDHLYLITSNSGKLEIDQLGTYHEKSLYQNVFFNGQIIKKFKSAEDAKNDTTLSPDSQQYHKHYFIGNTLYTRYENKFFTDQEIKQSLLFHERCNNAAIIIGSATAMALIATGVTHLYNYKYQKNNEKISKIKVAATTWTLTALLSSVYIYRNDISHVLRTL